MRRPIRATASVTASVALIATMLAIGGTVQAATSSISGLAPGDIVSGTVPFDVAVPGSSAIVTTIDDEEISGSDTYSPAQLQWSHFGLASADFANTVVVNGAESIRVATNSANPDVWLTDPDIIDVAAGALIVGRNELRVTAGTATPFIPGTSLYGTNMDDFSFRDLSLKLPNGEVKDPVGLVEYHPVAVGSAEITTVERPYQAGKTYLVGDGWPGGTGITSKLPVAIGVIYDLSEADLHPVVSGVQYVLDTTEYFDGLHTVSVVADGTVVDTFSFTIDNANPAEPTVFDILDSQLKWNLTRPGSAAVSWDGYRPSIRNQVIDYTNLIGWPSISARTSASIEVSKSPYLYVDVATDQSANTSAWNIYFTNTAGKSKDLAAQFGYSPQSEIPKQATVRIDVRVALSELIVDGRLDLAEIALTAVTELDTSVSFNEVYFAGAPKIGDTRLYTEPPARPASTMTFVQPTIAADRAISGIAPESRVSGQVTFQVSDPDAGRLSATIDDRPLSGTDQPEPSQLQFAHRGLDSAVFQNTLTTNGGLPTRLTTSSANPDAWLPSADQVNVNVDQLVAGRNELVIAAGTAGAAFILGETRYGENLDDFDMRSLDLALPNGRTISPQEIVEYHPVAVGSAEYTTSTQPYSATKQYKVGDGWPGGSGITAGLPVAIGVVFTLDESDLAPVVRTRSFSVDTTQLADGTHTLTAFNDGVSIDTLEFESINAAWRRAHRPGYAAMKQAEGSKGTFTATVEVSAPHTGPVEVEFFTAELLPVTANAMTDAGSVEFTAEQNTALTADGGSSTTTETTIAHPSHEFYVETGEYSGDILISYEGETIAGERVKLEVLNPSTGEYDPLSDSSTGRATDSASSVLQASATIHAPTYARDGSITVRATQLLVDNGSDTMFWYSDTQHSSYFNELTFLYEGIMNYGVEEYEAGRTAYIAHTGDVVEAAHNSGNWQVASDAFAILDQAEVPYGVVSGNHDVGNHAVSCGVESCGDYTQWAKYFGADRYAGTDWNGGIVDENINHYDLVTIGGNDFVVLYLGMGREGSRSTVAWANEVLQTYPHRNAIIALHQYLNYDGSLYKDHLGGNVEVGKPVFENIVVPNDNVIAVLSGHVAGAATTIHTVGDREVIAMLANYQSVNISGLVNATDSYFQSSGDEFMRKIQFTNDTLKFTTYSPYLDRHNAFAASVDTGSHPVSLRAPQRSLTTHGFSAVRIDEVKSAGVVATSEAHAVSQELVAVTSRDAWFARITTVGGATLSTGSSSAGRVSNRADVPMLETTTTADLVTVPIDSGSEPDGGGGEGHVPDPGVPGGGSGEADTNAEGGGDLPATGGGTNALLIWIALAFVAFGGTALLRYRARHR